MTGCEPVEMPVCEHLIPVKFYCSMCNGVTMDAERNLYQHILQRMNKLDEHKCRQIDENRKISRRVDELEKELTIVKQNTKEASHHLELALNGIHKLLNKVNSHSLCKNKG